jgi:hypothetical protein
MSYANQRERRNLYRITLTTGSSSFSAKDVADGSIYERGMIEAAFNSVLRVYKVAANDSDYPSCLEGQNHLRFRLHLNRRDRDKQGCCEWS